MRIGTNFNIYSPVWEYYGDEKYKKVKELGFDGVDFGLALTNKPIYTLPEEEAAEILKKERRLAEEAGIEIWQAHGPWCWPPPEITKEGRANRMEQMKRSIRAAATLGCKNWVVHPVMPYMAEEKGTELAPLTWEANLEFMGELLVCAKEHGVTICLENMPMPIFSMSKPEEILKFVNEMNDDNFKICLDTGHVAVFKDLDLAEETRRLGDKIQVLHVHDNEVGQDVHHFPFYGRIEWDKFREALEDIGYDGILMLELPLPPEYPIDLREDMLKVYAKIANRIANNGANG